MTWLQMAAVPAGMVTVMWVWHGVFLLFCRNRGWKKPEAWRWIYHELRPFYLPCVLIEIADLATRGQMLGWNTLWSALNLVNWWLFKDVDDDDRWKRRGRKLAEKVERLGGRLKVVPAEVSS